MNSEIYIGSTGDLKRRFSKHNSGKEKSTRRYMPWTLVYYESYKTERLARVREKRLKYNGNAIRELKKRNGLISINIDKNKKNNEVEGLPSTTFIVNDKSGAGFTLIELLLYIGLSSAMLLTVSIFLSVILQSRVDNQVVSEVEQQGWQVMNIITQTIRNSEVINSPMAGSSASQLSLNVSDISLSPTIFSLSGTAILMAEGSNLPVNLTSSRIESSNLNFDNLSITNTPGTVRITFTLKHINPENKKEYDYTKTFYGSASLR